MGKQNGVTLIGMLVVAVLIVMVALVGLRLLPAYMEFQTVKNTVTKIVNDPELKNTSKAQLKKAFDRRASIDNITVIGAEDLDITIENGQVAIEVEYAKKVPLFANISFCIDFDAKAGK